MEIRYVYELVNLMGTVEYVGESKNPIKRFYGHTKQKPNNNASPGFGKFYGRCDLLINVVDSFDNKKEAFEYQCNLQRYYGLETDGEKMKRVFTDSAKQKMRNAKLGLKRGPYKKK